MTAPTLPSVDSFDNYDQALLWAAFKAGYTYAHLVGATKEPKVAFVSKQDPFGLPGHIQPRYTRVIPIRQIAGLAESASWPSNSR